MAHQTGIEPNDKLKNIITKALKGSLRFVKVIIENECLVPAEHSEPHGTWEEDFDIMIQPVLQEKMPCYIFYRLDERNAHQNYLWVFMSYTPDFAIVKEKMMYAATKATVKKAFSSGIIIEDIAATNKEEMTLKGYKKHLESQQAAPPLTEAEQELKIIRENEAHADIGTSTRHSHLHGVAFPINQDALDAIVQLKQGTVDYVRLLVDVKNEVILLDTNESEVDADSLPKRVPVHSPRYHLYQFKHTYEGEYQVAIVFIYSCPGFKSSIKERMLYSSCKEPLITGLEQDIKLTIDKKIEIDSPDDLSEQFLLNEVHPPTVTYRPKFMKPKAPGRKRSRSPAARPNPSEVDVSNGSPPAED